MCLNLIAYDVECTNCVNVRTAWTYSTVRRTRINKTVLDTLTMRIYGKYWHGNWRESDRKAWKPRTLVPELLLSIVAARAGHELVEKESSPFTFPWKFSTDIRVFALSNFHRFYPYNFRGPWGSIWNLRRKMQISANLGKFDRGNLPPQIRIPPKIWKFSDIWKSGNLREIWWRKHSIILNVRNGLKEVYRWVWNSNVSMSDSNFFLKLSAAQFFHCSNRHESPGPVSAAWLPKSGNEVLRSLWEAMLPEVRLEIT